MACKRTRFFMKCVVFSCWFANFKYIYRVHPRGRGPSPQAWPKSSFRALNKHKIVISKPCKVQNYLMALSSTSSSLACSSALWAPRALAALAADMPWSCSFLSSSAKRPKKKQIRFMNNKTKLYKIEHLKTYRHQ